MEENEQTAAWNNLVMNADPSVFEHNDKRRAAAIACIYMSLANNGGINNFLTSAYDLDSNEILASLEDIGANLAANELRNLLNRLGKSLPASTESERWDCLDELWTDQLDEFDMLTTESDQDLMVALEKHVKEYANYYLGKSGSDESN